MFMAPLRRPFGSGRVLVEPEHSLIDLLAPRQGVLSQNLGQHQLHLSAVDSPALNQADHHPHMLEYHRVESDRALLDSGAIGLGPVPGTLGRRSSGSLAGLAWWQATAPLIEFLLGFFASSALVISLAPAPGSRAATLRPAAKGTPNLPALMQVARMRQKENAAVRTAGPTAAQMGFGPQHRSQNYIVFQHQGRHGALPIPVGPKLKMLRDPGCKQPKLWLRMLALNLMSPSYRTGAQVSSRRDGDFCGSPQLHSTRRPCLRARLLGKEKPATIAEAGGSI